MRALTPQFPPLLRGLAAGPANPISIAQEQARAGIDAGLIVWSQTESRLRAALVLAPDAPLLQATAGFVACTLAAQNALGIMAPPETSVLLEWGGAIRMNGARVGHLQLLASDTNPETIPHWMIVALEVSLAPISGTEPGKTPEITTLYEEGCADLDPILLLEAWARHSLLWLNTLEAPNGRADLHREWAGLAADLGKKTRVDMPGARLHGVFLGVDENFAMLLKTDRDDTRLLPLSALIAKD